MTKLLCSAFLLAGAMTIAGCGDPLGNGDPIGPVDPIDQLPRDLSIAELGLIEADNAFALKLFKEINAQQPDNNLFISPLSVAMALGMTYNGADGETQAAMQQALELEGMSVQHVNEAYRDLIDLLFELDPLVQFDLANSIWYRENITFEQAFLDVNRDYFDATVSGLDFSLPSAPNTINAWVRENTGGKIEEIVASPIPLGVVMYLINAVYFKGTWTYQFDRDLTQDAPFTLLTGNAQAVEMMSYAGEADLSYTTTDLFEAVDLPYGGQAFTMTVLLPREGVHVDAVVDALDSESWNSWMSGLAETSAIVSMPKFTLEYEIELKDVLEALGMGVAFTGAANFSKMRPENDLFISKVTHKTFVDVYEEGTEAAAATSVEIGLTCACGPFEFRVDRPYVFAIREKHSGTIIFMGKIVDPVS
jgi:serpin B